MRDIGSYMPLHFALNGGEEYELLFTSNLTKSIYLEGVSQNGTVHDIGLVSCGSGVCLKRQDGVKALLNAQAWSHL